MIFDEDIELRILRFEQGEEIYEKKLKKLIEELTEVFKTHGWEKVVRFKESA